MGALGLGRGGARLPAAGLRRAQQASTPSLGFRAAPRPPSPAPRGLPGHPRGHLERPRVPDPPRSGGCRPPPLRYAASSFPEPRALRMRGRPGRGASSAAGALCAGGCGVGHLVFSVASSALVVPGGQATPSPDRLPGPAEEQPGVAEGPFVPLPDALPRLSADGFWPGLQSFPAPSRPSRGKGLNGRVILLTAWRGNAAAKRISAGRRAIVGPLLPFRHAQLRPPRARSSPGLGSHSHCPSRLLESSFLRRP